jgi:hypothetical protein
MSDISPSCGAPSAWQVTSTIEAFPSKDEQWRSRMEKEFTAATLEEARAQAGQWLAQKKGIRLIRQKQASAFGPGDRDVEWTVTLYYEADGNQVLPEISPDDDEGVGTV